MKQILLSLQVLPDTSFESLEICSFFINAHMTRCLVEYHLTHLGCWHLIWWFSNRTAPFSHYCGIGEIYMGIRWAVVNIFHVHIHVSEDTLCVSRSGCTSFNPLKSPFHTFNYLLLRMRQVLPSPISIEGYNSIETSIKSSISGYHR